MELYTSNVYYNGKTYNDCFAFCKYETELNDIIQFLLDESAAVCNLAIPTCITVTSNTTSNILQALLTKACEAKVRVSTTDPCLGWLKDKFTSTDGSITFLYPIVAGCQTIDLSVNVTAPSIDTNIVLDSSFTSSSTSNASTVFRNISVPFNTLVTNGSALMIDATFAFTYISGTLPINTPLLCYIKMNGFPIGDISYKNGDLVKRLLLRVVKISDTLVSSTGTVITEDGDTKLTMYSNVSVNNLLSVNNTITFTSGTIYSASPAYSYSLTNYSVTVDKFKK